MRRTAALAAYVVSNGMAAAGTYLLILAFAYRSDSASLGVFAMWSAAAAILVTIPDTFVTQQTIQAHTRLHNLEDVDITLRRSTAARSLLPVVVSAPVCLAVSLLDWTVAGGFAILVVGQAMYTAVIGPRVVASRRTPMLVLQSASVATLTILAAGVYFISDMKLTPAAMLALFGASRVAVAAPAFLKDLLVTGKGRLHLGAFSRTVRLGAGRRQSAQLLGVQVCNGVTAQLDALLAGLGGLAAAGAYQVAQRPLAALSVANVAISQLTLSDLLAGRRTRRKRLLGAGLAMLIIWPLTAAALSYLVNWISPSGIAVPVIVFALLGVAWGLAGVAALTGPLLLLRGRNGQLLVGAAGQAVAMLAVGIAIIPSTGLFGLAVTVIAGRAAACLVQLHGIVGSYSIDATSASGRTRSPNLTGASD